MARIDVVALALTVAVAADCHAGAPPRAAESTSQRTVFTDSLLHSQLCQPSRPGEDWHRVCTPLDQGVRPVRPVTRPPQR